MNNYSIDLSQSYTLNGVSFEIDGDYSTANELQNVRTDTAQNSKDDNTDDLSYGELSGFMLVIQALARTEKKFSCETQTYTSLKNAKKLFLNEVFEAAFYIKKENATEKLRVQARSKYGLRIRENEDEESILLRIVMRGESRSRIHTYRETVKNALAACPADIKDFDFLKWLDSNGGIEASSKNGEKKGRVVTSAYTAIFDENLKKIDKHSFTPPKTLLPAGLQLFLVYNDEGKNAQFLHSFSDIGLLNQAKVAYVKNKKLTGDQNPVEIKDNMHDAKVVQEALSSNKDAENE